MSILAIKRKLFKSYLKFQFKRFGKDFKTDKCKLSYLFIPKKSSDKLLIIFSGFGAPGKPAVFNYVRSLQTINANRLYILDDFGFDKRGAYYLGKEDDFFIEEAVLNLINEISVKNNIKKENIVVSGSSKGGYAALYFGLKYGYGEVLAGAPQTLLGDYLIGGEQYKQTLKYLGGEDREFGRKRLNALLFDIVHNRDNNTQPNIRIHVGRGDHHYKNHVIPFTQHLNRYNLKYDLDVADYTNHGDVGAHFPPFVMKHLNG